MILRRNLNLIICFVLFLVVISISALSYTVYTASTSQADDPSQPFSDVPQNSYAYTAIHDLRRLGITNGVGENKYGYGRTLTRGEFVTFLVKLMEWEQVVPASGSFTDNRNVKKFYYAPVETALLHGIISANEITFRPNDSITREEAAVMIVSCLGYGELSTKLDYLDKPFEDVTGNVGAITIAQDFGIASVDTNFNPSGNILREQAAAMLIRMRSAMERSLKELNAFYALKSSPQMDKIPDLTSVCFGWSKISFDQENAELIVNTTKNTYGDNDFNIPTGFTSPLSVAEEAGVPAMLMVYSSQDEKIQDSASGQKIGIPEYLLTNPEAYQKIISDIIAHVKSPTKDGETGSPFDGVVIDFENLRGETLKQSFNAFLKELDAALELENKKLFVAVHPLFHPKRSSSSIDGYDYRTIGSLADKVILMAHDYDAKSLSKSEMAAGITTTPLTPIEDVYYALQRITDYGTGVQDKSRIMLQISFDWTVWKKKGGKTINSIPAKFNLENFMKLLQSNQSIEYNYSEVNENPFIKYIEADTGNENTVWYENSQSVMEKVKLAKLFGIRGISLWRLGQIPDVASVSGKPDASGDGQDYKMDVWQKLLNEME